MLGLVLESWMILGNAALFIFPFYIALILELIARECIFRGIELHSARRKVVLGMVGMLLTELIIVYALEAVARMLPNTSGGLFILAIALLVGITALPLLLLRRELDESRTEAYSDLTESGGLNRKSAD